MCCRTITWTRYINSNSHCDVLGVPDDAVHGRYGLPFSGPYRFFRLRAFDRVPTRNFFPASSMMPMRLCRRLAPRNPTERLRPFTSLTTRNGINMARPLQPKPHRARALSQSLFGRHQMAVEPEETLRIPFAFEDYLPAP